MLSVQEAANKLGISTARVRALLKSGLLEGEKIGRAWAVSESSVVKRLASNAQPGRPASSTAAYTRPIPDIDQAHVIYESARKTLTGCYSADLLKQARTPEEEAFWICVSDFFLQRRQIELIKQGVY